MVAPAIEDFVFAQALRISEHDFLAGARHAALVTNEAAAAAILGDEAPLEALERTNSLTPTLHGSFEEEAIRLRAGAAASRDAALGELEAEQRRLDASVALSHVHLLVGATRDLFPHGGSQRHVLSIGSHLSVVGDATDNLWSVDTQGELLGDMGCTVSLRVSLGEDAAAPEGRGYLFEAAVTGDMLLREAADDELHFQLADVHGRTGDTFWAAAHEVAAWKA